MSYNSNYSANRFSTIEATSIKLRADISDQNSKYQYKVIIPSRGNGIVLPIKYI